MTGRTRIPGLPSALSIMIALLVSVVSVVALAGCGGTSGAAGPATSVATPTRPSPSTPSTASSSPTPTGPAPLPKQADVTVSSIDIGSIGVKTSHLEQLSLLKDGELAAPKNPDRAGWFSGGTVPGEVGPAVIAGHIDSKTGPAVFFELRLVQRGDVIKVGLSTGRTVTFVVDRVITTAKKGFPTDAVFGPTPDAELRVITCGGPYDRTVQSYLDNTIVFATER